MIGKSNATVFKYVDERARSRTVLRGGEFFVCASIALWYSRGIMLMRLIVYQNKICRLGEGNYGK